MVGSVLLHRMRECGDFGSFDSSFFTTSQKGVQRQITGLSEEVVLKDAYNFEELSQNAVILSCQGGEYSKQVYSELRKNGWSGYWIDAASFLRMHPDSTVILDPVNRNLIDSAIEAGKKNFIGGNCTVSLMLMALHGLFNSGVIEWVSSMTYQAASGAGAESIRELISQMGEISEAGINKPDVLEMEETIRARMLHDDFPTQFTKAPLAGGLIPWIDEDLGSGQSREEWKAEAEANRILGTESNPTRIEGICVRVGTLRCHGQALMFKLKEKVDLSQLTRIINDANDWVTVIGNNKDSSIAGLSPAKISGTLKIPVGRLRKLSIDDNIYSAFTLGDQLLWGAAEPLRRMLKIIVQHIK